MGNFWACHTELRRRTLASGYWKPGMLSNIAQLTGDTPTAKTHPAQMSAVPKLGDGLWQVTGKKSQ